MLVVAVVHLTLDSVLVVVLVAQVVAVLVHQREPLARQPQRIQAVAVVVADMLMLVATAVAV